MKNYIYHKLYLRNHKAYDHDRKAYDHDFWFTCV